MCAVIADDYEDDDEEEAQAPSSAQKAQTAVQGTVSKLTTKASGLAGVSHQPCIVWHLSCDILQQTSSPYVWMFALAVYMALQLHSCNA